MIVEQIAECLDATFSGVIDESLSRHLAAYDTDRWLLFSDYVLGDKSRPNNAYAFSLMPGGKYLEEVNASIDQHALKDLKDTKLVSEGMIGLLKDPRILNFCFLLEHKGLIPLDRSFVVRMLDQTVAQMEKWSDVDSQQSVIRKFRNLAHKSKSLSFNRKLLDQMITASALAAYLTYRVCELGQISRFGWFSDRDNITTSYNAVANEMYSVNVNALFEKYLVGSTQPSLGLNAGVPANQKPWYDNRVRIADHLAGITSAWDVHLNTLSSSSPKYRQILVEVIADNLNLHLVRLTSKIEAEKYFIFSSRVTCSKMP